MSIEENEEKKKIDLSNSYIGKIVKNHVRYQAINSIEKKQRGFFYGLTLTLLLNNGFLKTKLSTITIVGVSYPIYKKERKNIMQKL